MKRVLVASVLLVAVSATSSFARDINQKRLENALKRLDPSTRLEQVCDAAAMSRIQKENKGFRVDRSVVSALQEPQAKGDTLTGKGGAPLQGQVVSLFFYLSCDAGPAARAFFRI